MVEFDIPWSHIHVHIGEDWILGNDALIIAGVASVLSVSISLLHLVRHLKQYSMPQIQMWIVRIILICPAYAISSSLAMYLGSTNGLYVEFVRDLYEAFVVYSLLNLVMEYCGGEVDCVYAMENEAPLQMPFPFCCMKPKPRDTLLLRFCQRGVLQFVVVKPIMAIVDVCMMATGNYYNEVFIWIEAVIYNASYMAALYALLVMYLATHKQLEKFGCIAKISATKMIIVISYYQSLAIKLAPVSEEKQFLWKCFALSLEMVLFAMILSCAFPISEFMAGIPDRRVLSNMRDLFAVKDLYEGFIHNFKPAYHDYALQRQQNEAPETIRLRTYFVGNVDNVAMEMTERYRGRSSRMAFNALLRGEKPIRATLSKERRRELFGHQFDNNGDDLESGNPLHGSTHSTQSNSSLMRESRASGNSLGDIEDTEEGEERDEQYKMAAISKKIDNDDLLGRREVDMVDTLSDAHSRSMRQESRNASPVDEQEQIAVAPIVPRLAPPRSYDETITLTTNSNNDTNNDTNNNGNTAGTAATAFSIESDEEDEEVNTSSLSMSLHFGEFQSTDMDESHGSPEISREEQKDGDEEHETTEGMDDVQL
jgi:hypothetical protein